MTVEIQNLQGITELTKDELKIPEVAKQVQAAEKILEMVRRRLGEKYIHFRMFFRIFQWTPVKEKLLLETDGLHMFYQPEEMIRLYERHKLLDVENQMLHITFHGILGHFSFRRSCQQKELADVVMNRESELIKNLLGYPYNSHFFMNEGKENGGARHMYQKARFDARVRRELRQCASYVNVDKHQIWERPIRYLLNMEEEGIEAGAGVGTDLNAALIWEETRETAFASGIIPKDENQLKNYLGNQYGNVPGESTENVTARRKGQLSYREVLQMLLKEKECYKEQEETIDKMLYTYGFELYEEVALIEPEESGEIRQFETLVIAIDTSGSCSGEICENFLGETKSLLEEISELARFRNIVLLQCDERVQEEEIFQEARELPEENTKTMRGFGGTNFEPVFERVNQLKEQESMQIDALFYLTDTYGRYPQERPQYPVYFVIPTEEIRERELTHVPDWIEKIWL